MPLKRTRALILFTLFSLLLGDRQLLAQNDPYPAFDPGNTRFVDSAYQVHLSQTSWLRQHLMVNYNSRLLFPRTTQPVTSKPAGQAVLPGIQPMLQAPAMHDAGTDCYVESARNFLFQDSLIMWAYNPTATADGHVLICGEFSNYNVYPIPSTGGFCMKTDILGNLIWATLIDSAVHKSYDFQNYRRVIELKDGSILLAGRSRNPIAISDDFILTKLDRNGNMIWSKTYQSRLWEPFNGSGDSFLLNDLQEDPFTGDIYFVGSHWFSAAAVTKIASTDGRILWSNAYDSYDSDNAFGLVINNGNLLVFQLSTGYYNQSTVTITSVNKQSGDTLFTKHFTQTGDPYAPRLYQTFEVKKLNNGHFLLSGPTTGFLELPVFTGTKDLYHAGIIELDEQLDFVQAYGFKNRVLSNMYNTKLSLAADGSGLFTMFDYHSSYTGESEVCLFRDKQIYHQRRRVHLNEGIPYEPLSIPLKNAGWLNIKIMGDSTQNGKLGARYDFYRIHSSDTATDCLGLPDNATSFWNFNFERVYYRRDTIARNLFSESRPKTYSAFRFTTRTGPACKVVSLCDTLALKASAVKVCFGDSVILTTYKNKACGSLVPLQYDTTWVSNATRLTDTTWALTFNKAGEGYIRASLLGCSRHEDSVLIQVAPALNGVTLGPDTSLCAGNTIQLNAGKGFASYKWQDGSTDSVLTVTSPGRYFVSVINNCGKAFSDTVEITARPPVTVDIGPDRVICRGDTAHLVASSGFMQYTWANNYYISKLTGQSVIVQPLTDTVYYLKAEKTPGCFGFDTIGVRVNQFPSIHLGPDTSFCAGDSLVLDGGNGFTQWLWNTGGVDRFLNAKTAGIFIVTGITSHGCKSRDTLRILQVYANPKVDLGRDSVICRGSQKILDAGPFSTFAWNTGNTSRQITVVDTGFYWVKVTDGNNCAAEGNLHISRLIIPPANFLPADTAICNYGDIKLSATQSFKSYVWNNGQAISSITVTSPGLYWLQVTDQYNCKGSDTIRVAPRECLNGLYVPTAFTPNYDGKNDRFRPLIFGKVLYFEWSIYNRFGEIMFHTTDVNKGWDGMYKNMPQAQGHYIWKCSYQLEGESIQVKSGSVILVR